MKAPSRGGDSVLVTHDMGYPLYVVFRKPALPYGVSDDILDAMVVPDSRIDSYIRQANADFAWCGFTFTAQPCATKDNNKR